MMIQKLRSDSTSEWLKRNYIKALQWSSHDLDLDLDLDPIELPWWGPGRAAHAHKPLKLLYKKLPHSEVRI